MNIKIDLNITLPDAVVSLLVNLLKPSVTVTQAEAPAPKASKAKAEPADAAPAAETTATAEPAATLPPVNVTDEMIVAAADAAVVKVGSNPQIIKQAVAARFQKEDGSPGTLMTTRKDQRPALHAFLLAVGQTGDVNA
jgi:hypothetical protein